MTAADSSPTLPRPLTPLQAERRQRILRVTRRELARLGYDRLNMRDLSLTAGVSTATLYNLYLSKDDLILAALEDLLAELQVCEGVRGLDHLMVRVGLIGRQVVDGPRYAEAMSKMLFNADPEAPVVARLIADPMARYLICLQEMQADGDLLAEVDAGVLARELIAASWGCITLWLKGFVLLADFEAEYRRAILRCLYLHTTDACQARMQSVIQLAVGTASGTDAGSASRRLSRESLS